MRRNTIVMALFLLIALVVTAGVMIQGGVLGNLVFHTPSANQGTVGGNVTDLTNEGDPLAAQYRNNTSFTQFANVSNFTPELSLELVANNFTTSPMMVTSPPDGTGRLCVVDQIGLVKIVDANGTLASEPFLDLRDKLVNLTPAYDERGLLSIAFHPDYQSNGKLYVFYSAPLRPEAPEGWNCTNHLSEFTVSSDNPNRVNASSERILMYIDKPYHNHNGGQIAFSPRDGYLYVPLGDGGLANDVGNGHTPVIGNAQDLTKIYGKILRIDVDGGDQSAVPQTQNVTRNTSANRTVNPPEPTWTTFAGTRYGIPPDNPFVGNQTPILRSYAYSSIPPEIYAYGFRNPAYLSFDSEGSNAPFIASAGQLLFESVFIVAKGGNYGWNIREGTFCFDPNASLQPPATCNISGYQGEPLIGPVIESGHDLGNTVIGGQIYRGNDLPAFDGRYVFGYWSDQSRVVGNGSLLVASPPANGTQGAFPDSAENLTPRDNAMWSIQKVNVIGQPNGTVNAFLRSVGEGGDRELYVLTNDVGGPNASTMTGKLWKVIPAGGST
jgi:glucose/arabinose dehydrogenase